MKTILSILLLNFISVMSSAQNRCGTVEYLELLKKQSPDIIQKMEDIEQHLQKQTDGASRIPLVNVTIPVVFHVLHNSTSDNISDAQINTQMTILNQDYSGTNLDIANVPSLFQGVKAGNTGIQFCLARRDPNGLPTNGIVRKYTSKSSFPPGSDAPKQSSDGDKAWSVNKYLNIWVVPNIDNSILGYATYPGSDYVTVGNSTIAVGGVVIGNKYIGHTGTATAPYNKGRTATHEVGHWLGLKHIWGDTNCGDDEVGDTPSHNTSNLGCPVYPHASTCSGSPIEMTMNYMDYTNDACMYMFSNGQNTQRIQPNFTNGGGRYSFLAAAANCATLSTITGVSQFGGSLYNFSWTPTGLSNRANIYSIRYRTVGVCPENTGSWITWATNITNTSYTNNGLPYNKRIELQVKDNNDPQWSVGIVFNTKIQFSGDGSQSSFAFNSNLYDQSIVQNTTTDPWLTYNPTDTYSFWGGGYTRISMYAEHSGMRFKVQSSVLNPTWSSPTTSYYGSFYSYTNSLALTTSSGPYSITTEGIGSYVIRLERCNISGTVIQDRIIASSNSEISPFNLYPNPANTEVVIQVENPEGQAIEISDISGKIQVQGSAQDNFTVISTQDLSSGIYFVKTIINGAVAVKKLIINH